MSNCANYGGGIYSERSYLIMVHHKCSYLNNTALQGRAQYFVFIQTSACIKQCMSTSKTIVQLKFVGAIYVEDVPSRNECFIQNNQLLLDLETTPLVFEKNTSGMRGSGLYGGLLNKCSFILDRYTSTLQLFNISILKGNGDN